VTREIKSVGVVGLGTMGAGIVEVFAREGFAVTGLEISAEALERGRGHLEGSTARAATRGKLSEDDRAALLARVSWTTSYDDLADCDLVIEAVPELMKLKRIVLGELDRVCKPGAVLATNTSSLSVTEIAMTTSRPESVIGMHFFNPAPVMKLVEVVHSVLTDADSLAAVVALTERLGKTPVVVADRAGFVANYLLFGYLNRAIAMYSSGYVGREELDDAMRIGAGLPMGPLTLLDLVGNDTTLEILETMYAQTADPLHAPAPLLRQLVTVGALGRKTGRGFYTYEGPGSGTVTDSRRAPVDENAAPAKAPEVLEIHGNVARDEIAALAATVPEGTPLLVCGALGDLTERAVASGRPADVVGFHVLEPTRGGQLVEIVTTVATSPETLAAARAVAAERELTAVEVGDRAGYVVCGLLFPFLNDAIRMVESGYATVDNVDHAMTLGCGYPFGPIGFADQVGLDRVLALQEDIYREERRPGLAPATLLQDLVKVGRIGRETGHGFRDTGSASA
jgi:3-hydroxybutyryl-CoA dehydrogenase